MSAWNIVGLVALGLYCLSGISFGQEVVTFAHYNIENYLEMNRRESGEVLPLAPRSAGDRQEALSPAAARCEPYSCERREDVRSPPPNSFGGFSQGADLGGGTPF